MLSKNRRQNVQIDGTGQFGEGLLLLLPPGDFCDLGFYRASLASTASDVSFRAFDLPRTVDLDVFRAKKTTSWSEGEGNNQSCLSFEFNGLGESDQAGGASLLFVFGVVSDAACVRAAFL